MAFCSDERRGSGVPCIVKSRSKCPFGIGASLADLVACNPVRCDSWMREDGVVSAEFACCFDHAVDVIGVVNAEGSRDSRVGQSPVLAESEVDAPVVVAVAREFFGVRVCPKVVAVEGTQSVCAHRVTGGNDGFEWCGRVQQGVSVEGGGVGACGFEVGLEVDVAAMPDSVFVGCGAMHDHVGGDELFAVGNRFVL